MGLLLLLAVLIFVAAVVVHGGVLLYTAQLMLLSKARKYSLRSREAFDPGVLELLNRLDAKISVAEGREATGTGLLSKHITLLPLMDYLENVAFRSFPQL